jgi:hypothetical protein
MLHSPQLFDKMGQIQLKGEGSMSAIGERQEGTICPEFDRSISIDFQGAKITSDTGFLLLRQVDERYKILDRVASRIKDPRSPAHTDHSILQLLRQRAYQVGAGYEDCNDADQLRVDPALRLALGKAHDFAASQPTLCRFENEVLATDQGLKALEAGLSSCAEALLRRRNKKRLILDVDSTDDPVHGNQESAAFNGYYKELCYHPLFCFTGHGDFLAGKLRPGNVNSSDGVIEMLSPLVNRYRSWFKQVWLRADAAFAAPELYELCEKHRISYFTRLPINNVLKKLIHPHLKRPAGRPPESGVQVKVIELQYQAESWDKPRRVVCKLEWHTEELFPRVGFIVTNSRLDAEDVIQVYNGRAEIENRIKEGKNTLRWDKTSCQSFAANKARLFLGALSYNLIHLLRDAAFWGEKVKPSVEWIIRRLFKVGARVVYHARRWHVHVASAFPLSRYYRILLT